MEDEDFEELADLEPEDALGVFDQEDFEEENLSGIDPYIPTHHAPGSSGKVLVLEARYALGIPLWNPDDAKDANETTHRAKERVYETAEDRVSREGLKPHPEAESEDPEEIRIDPEPPMVQLPILPMVKKICPETGKEFECGAGTGHCWCYELPVVEVVPGQDCTSKPVLVSKAMEQELVRYSHCPECQAEMGPVLLRTGISCPICQKKARDPREYEDMKVVSVSK